MCAFHSTASFDGSFSNLPEKLEELATAILG